MYPRRNQIAKKLTLKAFGALSEAWGYFPTRTLRMGTEDEALRYVQDLIRFGETGVWGPKGSHDYRSGKTLLNKSLAVYGAGDRLFAPSTDVRGWMHSVTGQEVEVWEARSGRFGLRYRPGHSSIACDPRSENLWSAVERWLSRSLWPDECG